ncbi:MAG: cupin domain-containing protein [Luteimonas sp.]|nr:cupin domain-containing protein [Luteimonas sp.]
MKSPGTACFRQPAAWPKRRLSASPQPDTTPCSTREASSSRAGWRVSHRRCARIPAPLPGVSPSVVVQERDIAVAQPGPHEGEGTTTAYPFFADATGFDLVFRKRALHPGASIGAHVNDKDEIYYVLSGRGELVLNGAAREVGPGDAVLTRSGDSHALRQVGDEDLVIFIVFDDSKRTP